MKIPSCIIFVVLFSICVLGSSWAQSGTNPPDDGVAQDLEPNYIEVPPVDLSATPAQVIDLSGVTLQYPDGATTSRDALTSGAATLTSDNLTGSNLDAATLSPFRVDNDTPNPLGNIDGLDTLPTFAGAFAAQAGPSLNRIFPFVMIGNHPLAGGTTVIPARVNEVSLQLLNADGTVNLNVPFAFGDLVEDSPNFEESNYRSGRHLQFADAVQRAEFFHGMEENWHTVLRHELVDRTVMRIPFSVNVRFPDGVVKQVPGYHIRTAANGAQFITVLDILFENLLFQQAVAEITANRFSTKALNMSLFPNTYLFSVNEQLREGCCVLGFHTFISQGAAPQRRFVFQYASWISPGIFRGGLADVTALSHETSEAFNDPFINNTTPLWQFPGVPATARVCQGNLETGDPVEVLPVSTVDITLRERHEVFTYHPQTEALFEWFEMGATSNAIDGAFSFPNEASLPHSALPCPPPPPPPPQP
jgi:hypothetical protein